MYAIMMRTDGKNICIAVTYNYEYANNIVDALRGKLDETVKYYAKEIR